MDDESRIEKLIRLLVSPLVTEPKKIEVSCQQKDGVFECCLRLAAADVGRVIGRQGKVISALRIIVNSLKLSHHQLVRLDIQGDKKLS
ncbi:KH domain-containing protein [Liquorilactobacillus sicerae]|uniref:KH domain-containing protein n=1 Tax=Liquorilactobacillus sicerae TaxID=1416943 RepID=UPI00247FFB95|nr:KH domain-containing protein [Liquorilactobacillus sicerae]